MKKIGILGASGRTGNYLLTEIDAFSNLELSAAIVSSKNPSIGLSAKGPVRFSTELTRETVASCDGWIDFSSPAISVELAKLCAATNRPVLVATTGHNNEQREFIKSCSNKCPVLIAPNTSIGISALREISLLAEKILGKDFDIEIVESHHKHKKDSPSGTALYLGNALAEQTGKTFMLDRHAHTNPRSESEIGFSSIRGGDVPGEHTIYFMGDGEQIEITHRIRDRKIFARGALKLMEILLQKPIGYYTVSLDFMTK